MNAFLIRVGADRSTGGGSWNGPADTQSGKFAYVAIPETHPVHAGMEKPYSALAPVLSTFGLRLPHHLSAKHMHLDPDFERLTYGDQGRRARQLSDRNSETKRYSRRNARSVASLPVVTSGRLRVGQGKSVSAARQVASSGSRR
jgi:hypothetical protein